MTFDDVTHPATLRGLASRLRVLAEQESRFAEQARARSLCFTVVVLGALELARAEAHDAAAHAYVGRATALEVRATIIEKTKRPAARARLRAA